MKNTGKKKVGIVLGSGSARGWAHIGVLKALEENKIPIDLITGTSIGALVGAVYASGNIIDFEAFVKNISWKTMISYIDISIPFNGLLSGKKVFKLFSDYFEEKTFKSLKIPFKCVATNILNGEEVVIDSGKISSAIRSSISIPGIFTPSKHKGNYLVDGGLSNPLPINIIKNMGADLVIAVNLNKYIGDRKETEKFISKEKKDQRSKKEIFSKLEKKYFKKTSLKDSFSKTPNIFNVIDNTIHIIEKKVTDTNLLKHKPDFLIEPELGDYKIFDFDRGIESIEEGYAKTIKIIPEIKSSLIL